MDNKEMVEGRCEIHDMPTYSWNGYKCQYCAKEQYAKDNPLTEDAVYYVVCDTGEWFSGGPVMITKDSGGVVETDAYDRYFCFDTALHSPISKDVLFKTKKEAEEAAKKYNGR